MGTLLSTASATARTTSEPIAGGHEQRPGRERRDEVRDGAGEQGDLAHAPLGEIAFVHEARLEVARDVEHAIRKKLGVLGHGADDGERGVREGVSDGRELAVHARAGALGAWRDAVHDGAEHGARAEAAVVAGAEVEPRFELFDGRRAERAHQNHFGAQRAHEALVELFLPRGFVQIDEALAPRRRRRRVPTRDTRASPDRGGRPCGPLAMSRSASSKGIGWAGASELV